MAVGPPPPPHSFCQETGKLLLSVDLDPLSSLEGVVLDIGESEVFLTLPGGEEPSRIVLPGLPASEKLGPAVAKFSKRRKELTVSWPTEEADEEVIIEEVEPASPPVQVPPPVQAPPPTAQQAPAGEAYGSIWNANSWHWEERKCLDLARLEVNRALARCSAERLKHVRELGGCGIVLPTVDVQGEASITIRKGKRILCYELTVSFTWEGRDEFGKSLGVKGTGSIVGLTQEEDEDVPPADIQEKVSFGGGKEAKAAGEWMKRRGVALISESLRAESLAAAVLASDVAQANPEQDRKRREAEKAKAEEARAATAATQARIAAEARQRETEARSALPTAAAVQGSVWNVNAWHWEEKQMSSWSREWLARELKALSPIPLLGGTATAEVQDVEVTGDASISIRKGKPIVLFQLALQCKWGAETQTQGIGDAAGLFRIAEFTSEDGAAGASIEVKPSKDESSGVLSRAVRADGIKAVRKVLSRFEEALQQQLPSGPQTASS